MFDTKLGEGKGSDPDTLFTFSKITDFTVGSDTIELDHAVFAALAVGALAADAFGPGKAATTGSQHILYDAASGGLRYDQDGLDGADPVLFARLAKGLALTAGDFLVA